MGKTAVVIVSFNDDEGIKKLSAEISTNSNISEIFVIDNSPPHPNLGFGAAANIGIRNAMEKGAEKIVLLNPDLKISSDTIDSLCQNSGDIVGPVLKFERLGKTVFDFGGKIDWTFGRTSHLEREIASPSTSFNENINLGPQPSEDRNRERDYISGACMMIKREVFEKIGFFDEQFFMYFEDVDFCLRAKQNGFKISVDTNVVVQHQISEHRFSSDNSKGEYSLKSNFIFIQKWVPWFFKPTALLFFSILAFRARLKSLQG